MALMFIAPEMKSDTWVAELKRHAPKLEVVVWPDVKSPDEIEFVLSWKHPHGEFRRFRNLKCIASMGAGVDHLLSDRDIPRELPITRIVDPSMTQSMSEYIVMSVLNHIRHADLHRSDRVRKEWRPRIPLLAEETIIGLLGLGQLGVDAARKLSHLGFPIRGWRRTSKAVAGIETYHGATALDAFLAPVHILVCVLPLTDDTKSILDRQLFEKLPQGAYLINVARGEHLVEADLLDMVKSGHLSGASLDVFRQEPLPGDHPFWNCPEIVITPHIASLTNPKAVVPQIIDNYYRMRSGQPLRNRVDKQQGY